MKVLGCLFFGALGFGFSLGLGFALARALAALFTRRHSRFRVLDDVRKSGFADAFDLQQIENFCDRTRFFDSSGTGLANSGDGHQSLVITRVDDSHEFRLLGWRQGLCFSFGLGAGLVSSGGRLFLIRLLFSGGLLGGGFFLSGQDWSRETDEEEQGNQCFHRFLFGFPKPFNQKIPQTVNRFSTISVSLTKKALHQ